jgi:hypothetical protein
MLIIVIMSTLNIVDDDGFVGLGDGGCTGADCCGRFQKNIININVRFHLKLKPTSIKNRNDSNLYETFPQSCV